MSDTCTHPGCTNEAIELFYPESVAGDPRRIEIAPGEEELPRTKLLCAAHARTHCFCSACESFVGGLDIWENPRAQKTGICDDCWEYMLEEITSNSDEDYD